jgi:hypothetical protein
MSRVVSVGDWLEFDDEHRLSSDHDQDCCEHHYLDFSSLTVSDFEGLEFDLSGDKFFQKVEDYGIRLVPINGHPVSIPGYGYNNGYYSHNLSLVLVNQNGSVAEFDVSECQEIKDY